MTFGAVASAVAPVAGALIGNAIGGGGGSSYQQPTPATGFSGANEAQADTGWLQAFLAMQALANNANSTASPLYSQSLAALQGINYAPYLAGANQVGALYGNAANVANQQAGLYGSQAAQDFAQQAGLYGTGNSIMQGAMDPQSALYNRTLQQLQDQVRAGQAARGLGNSPVGGAEENQALSNFNIDWQNNQLARQAQAASTLAQLSQAGGNQGQLGNASLAAQLSALNMAPQLLQQSYQIPIAAQQYVGGMPAANAAAYQGNLAGLQGQLSNVAGAALPYLAGGQGAQQQQFQQQFATTTGNNNLAAQGGAAGANIGSQLGSLVGKFLSPSSLFGVQAGPYASQSLGASLNNPSSFDTTGASYTF